MSLLYQTELPVIVPEERDGIFYFGESSGESRGEVFTKPAVVGFILDLVGWRVGEQLASKRLLEPSCGAGDFLLPAIERLIDDSPKADIQQIGECIRAVEINRVTLERARMAVEALLIARGFSQNDTDYLISEWLHHADFLTESFDASFTHVVGNPPYLRIEALPRDLMERYRSLFRTMYDRADLYIPFFEKGLSHLSKGGHLGFICSDRWMKNKYGGPLREFVSREYHLDTYVDLTGCDAFQTDVVAYPAVTVIRASSGYMTNIVQRPKADYESLFEVAEGIRSGAASGGIQKVANIAAGSDPWLLSDFDRLAVIQTLEAQLPTLEESGCRVGIGVATGADKVFIGSDEDLDVEASRKLPLATRRDLTPSGIQWMGKYVLNPFDGDQPALVKLSDYPKFQRYIESHRDVIMKRHVAKKNPKSWYKTIDRIYPELLGAEKLLIPDIQGDAKIVYDPGEYYPHHNLYYVTSDEWDLRALQAVLLSSVTRAFIATYSLRMRGDYLRYQAQYLRRIRLPKWSSLNESIQLELREAGISGEPRLIEAAVRDLYDLDDIQWAALSC